MDAQQVTLIAKAHDGTVTVSADIPVSGDAETHIVTIAVSPQRTAPSSSSQTLNDLYGALANSPMPEPEQDDSQRRF